MFKKGQTLAEESQIIYDQRLEVERKEKMDQELQKEKEYQQIHQEVDTRISAADKRLEELTEQRKKKESTRIISLQDQLRANLEGALHSTNDKLASET